MRETQEELGALRRDAARYRWLRARGVETVFTGGVFIGVTPDNLVVNFDDAAASSTRRWRRSRPMVAYSFQKLFAPAIESGVKRQTVRAPRKRHARVGELLQLYCGMRTRSCRKLIPDPICSRVDEIRFDLRSLAEADVLYGNEAILGACADLTIEINGIPLPPSDWRDFAIRDGFGNLGWAKSSAPVDPFAGMVKFWIDFHGAILFEGVVIHWGTA